jgi:hypothetical protein
MVISNPAETRAFIKTFTVSAEQANTLILVVIPIPAITTGVWPITTAEGLVVYFTMAIGPDLKNAGDGWVTTTGSVRGHTSQSNGAAVVASEFRICESGFYIDPFNTGIPPEYEIAHIEDDLKESQRYWYRAYGLRGIQYTAYSSNRSGSAHPVPMRIVPAFSLIGAVRHYDAGVAPNLTNVVNHQSTTEDIMVGAETSTAMTATRMSAVLVDGADVNTGANYIAVNARM